MTDYWKSTTKKFCELCKVWYADNRAQIEHHEQGQKHKAMIQQHLREMGKKATKKKEDQAQLNATLVAMEAAALAAMKKDGHEVAEPQSSSSTSSSMPVKRKMKVDPKEELKERKRKLKELKKTAKQSEFWNQDQADEFIEWVQSETGEGQCYYWNIFSGETVWEVPRMFYSAEEYSQNYESIQQKLEEEKKRLADEEAQKKKQSEDDAEAQRQYYEQYQQYQQQYYEYQQQLQAYASVPPPPPEEPQPEAPGKIEEENEEVEEEENPEDQIKPECTVYEPLNEEEKIPQKRSAYGLGAWVPVVKSPPRLAELQEKDKKKVYDDLPDQGLPKPELPDSDEDEAEIQFKEKTIEVKSSKKSKPVFFQKRKAQRNTRKTED